MSRPRENGELMGPTQTAVVGYATIVNDVRSVVYLDIELGT